MYKASAFRNSKSETTAFLFGGLFLFALIAGVLSCRSNRSTSAITGASNSQFQAVDQEYKASYQAGNTKGLQEGTNWAKKGWAIPLPLGISAMATTRVADLKSSKPEAWKHGFEKGFHDGYVSIRPITRKDEDYDQLSWSNAQSGVKLYNYSEHQEGTIVRVAKSSGLITVKFRSGTVEDKPMETVAPVWFVRKSDSKPSPSSDVNPYA